MKLLLAAAVLSTLVSNCADPEPEEAPPGSDAALAARSAAFLRCSCSYVMEMPDAYCEEWARAVPIPLETSLDRESGTAMSVVAGVLATARVRSDAEGCTLDDSPEGGR